MCSSKVCSKSWMFKNVIKNEKHCLRLTAVPTCILCVLYIIRQARGSSLGSLLPCQLRVCGACAKSKRVSDALLWQFVIEFCWDQLLVCGAHELYCTLLYPIDDPTHVLSYCSEELVDCNSHLTVCLFGNCHLHLCSVSVSLVSVSTLS